MEQLNNIVKELIEIAKRYKMDSAGLDANCILEQAVKIYLTEKIQGKKDIKSDKPSEKQIELMRKMGIKEEVIFKSNRKEASKIIEERLNTPKDY